MSVAFVRTHTAGLVTTAGTTVTFTLAAAIAAGNLIRVWVGQDNLTSTGPDVASITREPGETASWVNIASHNSSDATANGGTVGDMFVIRTTIEWAPGTHIVTNTGSVAKKAVVVDEFTGATTIRRLASVPDTSTTGVLDPIIGSGAAVTLQPGDLILTGATYEDNAAAPGDTATGWSSPNRISSALGGGVDNNIAVLAQHLISTGPGQIQWLPAPPSGGTHDSGAAIVALIADCPPAATPPTTGQIWPRGQKASG